MEISLAIPTKPLLIAHVSACLVCLMHSWEASQRMLPDEGLRHPWIIQVRIVLVIAILHLCTTDLAVRYLNESLDYFYEQLIKPMCVFMWSLSWCMHSLLGCAPLYRCLPSVLLLVSTMHVVKAGKTNIFVFFHSTTSPGSSSSHSNRWLCVRLDGGPWSESLRHHRLHGHQQWKQPQPASPHN